METKGERKWTYRGVGSDHEIMVRFRENTPIASPTESEQSSHSERKQEKPSSVAVVRRDHLQCSHCKRAKPTKDFWWCRTCQKTLCSSCNLLQGHTEHRTTPWRPEELVRSLVDTVEARCTARSVRASEEEAAVKEYMREIENYFLSKLRERLQERNEEDRDLIKAVSSSIGVTFADRKLWPPAIPAAPVSSNGGSTDLAQFSGLLTDDSLARLVKEISNRLVPGTEDAKTLTVTKWPRVHGSASPRAVTPCSSPLINGRVNGSSSLDDDDTSTHHFYSFAAVLPNIEPLEFAQLLEQQQGYSPELRSRSQSTLPPRGNFTPSMERVHSRAHSPARGTHESTPLAVYGTMNVNGDKKSHTPNSDTVYQSRLVYTSSQSHFTRGDYHRKSAPTSTVTTPRMQKSTVSSAAATSPVSQTEPKSELAVPSSTDSRRRYSLPSRHKSASKGHLPAAADSNADGPASRQRQLSSPNGSVRGKTTPVSITAFHFGEDYMTRPIDIRPVGDDLLAVSDSCGGVYVTDARGGKILHHIWLDGNSASSLCYVPAVTDKKEEHPPLLLVSVLGKEERCVRFYEAVTFEFLDEVSCPVEPEIDMARSRWLATDDQGSIFMVSGDGKVSALWKLHSSLGKPWALLKQAPKTRYQYLDVMHYLSDSTSVTLLTCDGIHGSILMITVSRAGKILAEQNFTESYGLDQYIHSPASAITDYRGNMLILDYSNGKLWILKTPRGTRQGGDRRLKLLTEFGSQQAMGIAIIPAFWQSDRFLNGEQWCYAACFNKKRVHAVKYLSD